MEPTLFYRFEIGIFFDIYSPPADRRFPKPLLRTKMSNVEDSTFSSRVVEGLYGQDSRYLQDALTEQVL